MPPKIVHQRTPWGDRIRSEREARDMTQTVLAALSGVPQQRISAIESGQVQSPGFEVIVTLARALGLTADELVEPETAA